MSIADEIARRVTIERAVLAFSHELVGKPPPQHDPKPTTTPRGASWRSGLSGGSPWNGQEGDLYCPACKARIATASVPTVTVIAEDEYNEDREVARQVPIGSRLTLEPGYVNARGRHASGQRWYLQGKRGSSPSPRVRLPAIVTCRCRQEIELLAASDVAEYATGDADARTAKLARELEAEAEDQFIQYQVDLARGK